MQTRAQVTTTTTVTGTTSNGMLSLNTGYLRTVNAWLKIVQILIGFIVLLMLVSTSSGWTSYAGNFLEMTAFCFLVITFLMLLSCIASLSGMTLLTTLFYINYHILAFIFYLAGSVAVFVELGSSNDGVAITAGVFGLFNSALYGINALFALKGRLN